MSDTSPSSVTTTTESPVLGTVTATRSQRLPMTPDDMESLTTALTRVITLTKQQNALTSPGEAYTQKSLQFIVDAIAAAQKELDAVQTRLKSENKLGGRTRRHRHRHRKTLRRK